MRLLLIRHAIAEDKDQFAKTGKPDADRPITAEGRKKMRRAARGLTQVMGEIQLLATSPFIRAKETADVVVDAYGDLKPSVWQELRPDVPPAEVLRRLRGLQDVERIALVGHQPGLGKLASYLLTGNDGELLELKKGGACLLDLNDRPEAGTAVLLAATPPALLRTLGRA